MNKLRGDNSVRLSTGFIIKRVMNRQSLQQQAQQQLSLRKQRQEERDDQTSVNLDSQGSEGEHEQQDSSTLAGLVDDQGQKAGTEQGRHGAEAKAPEAREARKDSSPGVPKAGTIIDRALKNIFNDGNLTQGTL